MMIKLPNLHDYISLDLNQFNRAWAKTHSELYYCIFADTFYCSMLGAKDREMILDGRRYPSFSVYVYNMKVMIP